MVGAGQWVSNRVVLQQLSADDPCCQLELRERQPRSLALLRLAGRQLLFVGCSTGELLWWELHASPPATAGVPLAIRLEPRHWVRAGVAPVLLQPMLLGGGDDGGSSGQEAAGSCCLLAKSDQLLMVSAAAGPSSGCQRVAVHRVHAPALASLSPWHTQELPHSLAFCTSDGQLSFARLDPQPAIRCPRGQAWGEERREGSGLPEKALTLAYCVGCWPI